jgi:hypothetical protein
MTWPFFIFQLKMDLQETIADIAVPHLFSRRG